MSCVAHFVETIEHCFVCGRGVLILRCPFRRGGCPLFLCVWDRGGFSVGGGVFLRVKRGVCSGEAGIGTWLWSFWLLCRRRAGNVRVRVCPQDFSLFPLRARAALMLLVGRVCHNPCREVIHISKPKRRSLWTNSTFIVTLPPAREGTSMSASSAPSARANPLSSSSLWRNSSWAA